MWVFHSIDAGPIELGTICFGHFLKLNLSTLPCPNIGKMYAGHIVSS